MKKGYTALAQEGISSLVKEDPVRLTGLKMILLILRQSFTGWFVA